MNLLSARFPIRPFMGWTIHRVVVAAIFITHGSVRSIAGTVTNFGEFLDSQGFPFGLAIAWGITSYELIGGTSLALGFYYRPLALIFIAHQTMAILLVHLQHGWFVVGHGTYGVEYSVLLIASLLAIASFNKESNQKP